MKFRGGETLTVTRDAGKDRFGDPLPPADPVLITGVAVIPSSSLEQLSPQDATISDFTAYLQPTDVIGATDTVLYRGEEYSVQGEPLMLHNPFNGRDVNLQISLRRYRGGD